VALFAFAAWLDEPTMRRAALAGAAFGFAVACKFSCIGYVPAACLAMYIVRRPRRPALGELRHLGVAALACIAILAASYGFMPRNFIVGIRSMIALDRGGFQAYLFGRTSDRGWWWYFPAAIALKTTLASLILIAASWVARRERGLLEPLAAAVAILAVAMTGNLDLGVRYILPIYVPLSIAAAAVAMKLPRVMAIALLVWHCGASITSDPDYFPYFNELAGREPSRYLIDSNIDWGQDALRLAQAIGNRRIAVSAMGLHDYSALGMTVYGPSPFVPVQGWLAVSEHPYRMTRLDGGWAWLDGKPYRRIGKSIRLYYVE
jgi:hypothetical protein